MSRAFELGWVGWGMIVVLVGCGGRVEADQLDPSAPPVTDAVVDETSEGDEAGVGESAPPAPPPFDGTPARCAGGGSHLYLRDDLAGKVYERELDASEMVWQWNLESPSELIMTLSAGDEFVATVAFAHKDETLLLTKGVYEPANEDFFKWRGSFGLSVQTGAHYSCRNPRGRFEIHDIEWLEGPTSTKPRFVGRLLATFEEVCEDRVAKGCIAFKR